MSGAARERLRVWLGVPAAHFIVLGAALFAVEGWLLSTREVRRAVPVRPPVIITAAEIGRMHREFIRRTGFAPGPQDAAVMTEHAIENEILYREALFRGLDRGDRSVRQRLINKMRFLNDDQERGDDELYQEARELGLDRDDVVIRRMLAQKMRLLMSLSSSTDEEPTDQELREYLDRHRQEYLQPARVSLWHVFLSGQRHGGTLEAAAAKLRDRLVSEGTSPADAVGLGDPFPLGHEFRSKSRHQLEKIFGPSFAGAVMALSPGAWSPPLESAYGLHIVWVSKITSPRVPDLGEVRGRVVLRVREDRQKARFARMMRHLRELYDVRVEAPAASKPSQGHRAASGASTG